MRLPLVATCDENRRVRKVAIEDFYFLMINTAIDFTKQLDIDNLLSLTLNNLPWRTSICEYNRNLPKVVTRLHGFRVNHTKKQKETARKRGQSFLRKAIELGHALGFLRALRRARRPGDGPATCDHFHHRHGNLESHSWHDS
jgi:hypothetical protein